MKPENEKFNETIVESDDKMIRLRDISPAICNCDMYPIPFPVALGRRTPEAKIMMETLDAAIAAIEQCPVYTPQGKLSYRMLRSYQENDQD